MVDANNGTNGLLAGQVKTRLRARHAVPEAVAEIAAQGGQLRRLWAARSNLPAAGKSVAFGMTKVDQAAEAAAKSATFFWHQLPRRNAFVGDAPSMCWQTTPPPQKSASGTASQTVYLAAEQAAALADAFALGKRWRSPDGYQRSAH